MGAPSQTSVVRGPGLLIVNPTDLTSPPYYGGTCLGATRAHEYDLLDDEIVVPAEEWAGAVSEGLEVQRGIAFYAILRSFDADAVAAMFANTSTGTSGGKVVNGSVQGSVRSGHLRSARVKKLLLAPNDATNGEAVIVYKAMPYFLPGDKTRLSILGEINFGTVWHSLPDTANSGRTHKIGRLSDLSL